MERPPKRQYKNRDKDLEKGRTMKFLKTTARPSSGDGTSEQRKRVDFGSEMEEMLQKMFEKYIGELDTWRREESVKERIEPMERGGKKTGESCGRRKIGY